MDLGNLNAKVTLSTAAFEKGIKTVSGGFTQMKGSVVSLNQGLGLAQKTLRGISHDFKGITASITDAADTTDKYRLTLDNLLGSRKEGARMFETMSDFAVENKGKKDKEQIAREEVSAQPLIGLDSVSQETSRFKEQLLEVGETVLEIKQDFQDLENIKYTNPQKQWEVNIEKLGDWKEGLVSVLECMQGPLEDFLLKFAETGKASGKELARALLQQLKVIAAAKTAELLMESAMEFALGFIRPDDGKDHFGNSMLALQSAGLMGSFIAGSGLAGMAHGGMTSIPEDGTWLLQKNERVVDAKTNADLKGFLAGKSSSPQVNLDVTINAENPGDFEKSIPMLQEMIVEVVAQDLMDGGMTKKAVQANT